MSGESHGSACRSRSAKEPEAATVWEYTRRGAGPRESRSWTPLCPPPLSGRPLLIGRCRGRGMDPVPPVAEDGLVGVAHLPRSAERGPGGPRVRGVARALPGRLRGRGRPARTPRQPASPARPDRRDGPAPARRESSPTLLASREPPPRRLSSPAGRRRVPRPSGRRGRARRHAPALPSSPTWRPEARRPISPLLVLLVQRGENHRRGRADPRRQRGAKDGGLRLSRAIANRTWPGGDDD